ncbi:MAG: YezD family protein, partial [Acidaminococcaceae bacterium]|nr:YezD family protein [Acidaminococcaceae bacterium]
MSAANEVLFAGEEGTAMPAEKSAIQNPVRKPQLSEEMIEQLQELIKTVKFGSISLIIQDGKVVQIDKNEKI